LATRKPSAKVTPQEIGSCIHEITLACFQPRPLPAALECASRAVAVANPVAKAFAITVEETRTSTVAEALADTLSFAEALIFAEGPANARSDTIAEAFPDPEAFPDTQTFSVAEARRGAGQRRG
jgi:hypothetical protein